MSNFKQLKWVLRHRYGGSGEFTALCSAAYSSVEDSTRARLQFLASQSTLRTGHPSKLSAEDFGEACRLVLRSLVPAFIRFFLPRKGVWFKVLGFTLRFSAVVAATALLMTVFTGPWIVITLTTLTLGLFLIIFRITTYRTRTLYGILLGTLAAAAFVTVLPLGMLSVGATALYVGGVLA